jgi:hypothetical protein
MPAKPKRKCSDKQLAVLKAGREKSSLYQAFKSQQTTKKPNKTNFTQDTNGKTKDISHGGGATTGAARVKPKMESAKEGSTRTSSRRTG